MNKSLVNHIGETNKNSKGERFVIINYRSATDVDIMFEIDGTVKNVTYAQFKSGHVSRKDTEDASFWLNEVIEDSNGETCKIVELNSKDNVTVQYPDGDIVAGLSLNTVMLGAFNREGKDFDKKKDSSGIDSERQLTYEHAVYTLNRFRRCVLIRPCGFGKTEIGLKLFSSPRYKRCLFLHPASDNVNSEKIKNHKSVKKIDARTYAWIRSRTEEQIRKLNYDIVFCDEVHCIGGDDDGKGAYVTYKAMKLFMESHPKAHFIGATATPLRMDGINVISTMFHNHICYPYTDEDAFEDGILRDPNYYYCIYDVRKRLIDEVNKKMNVKMNREEFQKALQLSNEDIDEIDTRFMDKHIRQTCDKILPDTKRMAFIAFYLTNDEIAENKGKIIEWFKKAYPGYQIKTITVTNRTKKSLEDVTALITEEADPKYKGRIDIIFNCEMLCMSFHSELITGLILDRKTQSLAKYMQMIGRLLSCDSDNPVIIFDIVDNIHSDFVCKAPTINTDIDTSVVVDFSKKQTFEDYLKAYPKARHWDEIKANAAKARKSEKLLIESGALNEGSESKLIFDDEASAPYYKPEKEMKKDVKAAIDEAQIMIKEKNMSVMDAMNLLAGIQDEYGTLAPNEVESITEPEVAAKTPYAGLYKKNNINALPDSQEIIEDDEQSVAVSVDTGKDPIGFDQSYYTNLNTREMYSKNFNVLNKRTNFKEDVLAARQAVKKKTLEEIIKLWHTYPPVGDDNYSKYEEIDKKSIKFQLLKSCSNHVYGIPVENVLVYMIEGKVA